MSLKIYDAYIFDKEYSILELSKKLEQLKQEIKPAAINQICELAIIKFLYYYNFQILHGKEKIIKLLDNKAVISSSKQHQIWSDVLKKDWKNLFYDILDYMDECMQEAVIHPSIDNDEYDFRCQLQLFPIEGKLLAMYFGRDNLQEIVLRKGFLLDYHYQNSCDKPDSISKEEWQQRAVDWKKAIEPDYIPGNHGFGVNLFPYEIPFMLFESDVAVSVNKEKLFSELLGTYDDFPDPPDSSSPYSEWADYFKTGKYLNWKKQKLEYLEKICCTDPSSIRELTLFIEKIQLI